MNEIRIRILLGWVYCYLPGICQYGKKNQSVSNTQGQIIFRWCQGKDLRVKNLAILI
jgi:hypothetical protein